MTLKHGHTTFVHIFNGEFNPLIIQMKYYIITGTSSGLGEALAEEAILQNFKVFCISRRLNSRLKQLGADKRSGLWYFEHDLTRISEIQPLMKEIFSFIDEQSAIEINLINNAGVVQPVGPLGKLNAEDILGHININLTAPVTLINEFIRETERFKCRKNIVNLTTGAASHPYFGWSLYCSSKAGVDMLTRVGGLEQSSSEFPVRIMAIAPGVVDTPMQQQIREVDPGDFPMKPKFDKLHKEGKLVPPSEAARSIIKMIDSDKLVNGEITDLRKI